MELKKKDEKLESQLTTFMHVGQFGMRNLVDATIELVDTLSFYLAYFGETYMEIISEDEGKSLSGKSLGILPQGRILKAFGRYIQVVPSQDWRHKEPRAIFIPADKIWHLKLPSELGSPRKHRRLIKRLNFMAQPGPMFLKEKSKDIEQNADYSFMQHNINKELAIESIVGIWGSIPSRQQIKGTTEYYYIIRRLQFSYCQALLREHIIQEFNSVLAKVGIRNNIDINGLIKASEVKNAVHKLHRGAIDFEEALEVIKIR